MKVAVTSQNFRTVTGHAGKTRRFLMFEVGEDGALAPLDRIDLPKEMSLGAVKDQEAAPHPIDAADVVLSGSFGAGFARRMARRGITASLSSETDPEAAVRAYLAHGPVLPADARDPGAPGHGHDHDHDHGGCNCGCGGH
ncbi:hypothetical protein CCR80_07400 [Rhodothalassium salexigens]|uniref:NifB/NifX family molybdenum-iron cluster-binding protein n=1 Tax=Rhodothalassium salexigens TaxID=1086 RepID=UPI001911E416|nr:hypothetical protein [Rhodothalassium salexigens]MBK5920857.1 hypothetical protein [Rhodothalassium salexigens]